jgi:hypothetical protein
VRKNPSGYIRSSAVAKDPAICDQLQLRGVGAGCRCPADTGAGDVGAQLLGVVIGFFGMRSILSSSRLGRDRAAGPSTVR